MTAVSAISPWARFCVDKPPASECERTDLITTASHDHSVPPTLPSPQLHYPLGKVAWQDDGTLVGLAPVEASHATWVHQQGVRRACQIDDGSKTDNWSSCNR